MAISIPGPSRRWRRALPIVLGVLVVVSVAELGAPPPTAAADQLDTLRIRTVDNLALQLPFARLARRNTLAAFADRVEIGSVRTPDEILALLTSGKVDVIENDGLHWPQGDGLIWPHPHVL